MELAALALAIIVIALIIKLSFGSQKRSRRSSKNGLSITNLRYSILDKE
ncbi:hypothetical protein [Wolinella succinogenes]|nr:hypothetical protein [Wolinella succinogenes]VEG81488.1 Uncharacterised protein [Wolinella succinogenes]